MSAGPVYYKVNCSYKKKNLSNFTYPKTTLCDLYRWNRSLFKIKMAKINKTVKMLQQKDGLEKGFSLGEMNTKLLRKIEELTLYIIEQEKRNKTQYDEPS